MSSTRDRCIATEVRLCLVRADFCFLFLLIRATSKFVFGQSYTERPVGRDGSVGIAIRYGLDCPGIESRWGRDFPHPSRPALGSTQPPVEWVRDLSRGKVAGAWR